MIARAGALDQGNICFNLADAAKRGISDDILFLAGSAINSIKDGHGKADPQIGTAAMLQVLDIYQSCILDGLPDDKHLSGLWDIACKQNLVELKTALSQRYHGLKL